MNTRKERKSKRPLPLRLLAVMLTCCMLFSSSGFDVLAQVVSDSSYEDDYEQQLAAEEAARKAAEAAAQQQAEEERAAAEAARAAAKNAAAADAAAAIAQQQANAGAKTSGGMDSSAFGAGESDAYVDNNVGVGSSSNGSISSNTAPVVTDTKLVLKAEATPDYQAGETAKVKVAYGLGSGCELASVETRLYVWNQTALFPQFDENGIYVNEDGRTFALKKDSEGDIYVEYMLKPGESFVQEFELADSSVTQGTSIDFDVVICAMGQIPTDQDIQTTPVRITYALPAEVPEAEGSEPTEIEESEAADAEMTEIDESAAVEGEPAETEEPAAAEGEPTETEDPAAAEGEQTETEEPAAAEGEPEDIDTFTESTETEETIVNASAPENQTTTEEDGEPAEESDGEFSEDEESEEEGTDEEGSEDETEYGTEFYYSDSQVTVTAKASPEAKIPANAELKADAIPVGSAEYEEAIDMADGSEDSMYVVYDIYFLVDGQEVEPEEGLVKISIDFNTPIFAELGGQEAEYSVTHITEDGQVEKVSSSVSTTEEGAVESVGFSLASFSITIIEGASSSSQNEGVMLLGLGVDDPYALTWTYEASTKNFIWRVYLDTTNKKGFSICPQLPEGVNVVGTPHMYVDGQLKAGVGEAFGGTVDLIEENSSILEGATEAYWEFRTNVPENLITGAINEITVSVGVNTNCTEGSNTSLCDDLSAKVTSADVTKSYDVADSRNTVTYTYLVDGRVYNPATGRISRDSTVKIRVRYDFASVNNPTVEDHDGYFYNLPDISALELDSQTRYGDIMSPSGIDVGDYEIVNNKVLFNYDPKYLVDSNGKPLRSFSGTFTMTYSIDKDEVSSGEDLVIEIPGTEKIIIPLQYPKVNGTKSYTINENGDLVFTIVLTADTADVTNVVVTDTLTGDFEFVKDSFSATNVPNFQQPQIEKINNGEKAIITIGEVKYGSPVVITYNVRPTSNGVDLKGANGAGIGYGEGQGVGTGSTNTVDIDLSETILDKAHELKQANNQIKYEIKVNELKADLDGQGAGGTIILQDVLDTERIALVNRTVSIKDNEGNDLLLGESPRASYTYADGVLNFSVPDETFVIITYIVRVKGEVDDPVHVDNTVKMTAPIHKEDSDFVDTIVCDSDATLTGQPGTITLTKVGKYIVGDSLPSLKGAVFELYEVDLEKNPLDLDGTKIETGTTDDDGRIIFGLNNSLKPDVLYYFVETKAPDNYIKSDVKTYFYISGENNKEFLEKIPSSIKVNKYTDGEYIDDVVNEKKPNPVEYSFTAKKTVGGGTPKENQKFDFTLSFLKYTPLEEGYLPGEGETIEFSDQTKQNNGQTVTFDPVSLKYEGTYTFVISENKLTGDNENSYFRDQATYYATILVKRAFSGDLEIAEGPTFTKDGSTVDEIVFNNIPTTGFRLTKSVTSAVKADTTFNFTITGSNFPAGTDLSKVEASEAESCTISADKKSLEVSLTVNAGETTKTVTFTGVPVGVKLHATEAEKAGWSLVVGEDSSTSLTIDSVVADSLQNSITAVNEYKTENKWTPVATKKLNGRGYREGEVFTYQIKDESGNVIATGSNSEDGPITFVKKDTTDAFEVKYTQDDAGQTFTYTIEEIAGTSEPGMTYDGTVYTVTVVVSDDGAGNLTATPTYKKGDDTVGSATFTNTYVAETYWTPTASKTLDGCEYNGTTFTYQLKEGETVKLTGSNSADGSITFDRQIHYTQGDIGKHYYTLNEVIPTDDSKRTDIEYDTTIYNVEVTVSDIGNGRLSANAVYKKSGSPDAKSATFVNRYKASGEWTPEGTKTFTGRDYKSGETFTYTVKEGDTVVATGSNSANGPIAFTTVEYDLSSVGTHNYVISEVHAGEKINGIQYDNTTYNVTVVVSDNRDGTLSVAADYQNKEVAFTNTYSATGEWLPKGTKTLDGRDYKTNETFTYKVMEGTNEVASGSNSENGPITFNPVSYDLSKVGTHYYKIYEVKGDEKGLTYDDTIYEVTVRVADNGDGTLNVSETYTNTTLTSAVFVNKYGSQSKWRPVGTKTLTGRAYKENETFTYTVKEGDKVVSTGTSDSNGTIEFKYIDYTLANTGKHTYVITEDHGGDKINGVQYDSRSYTVEVTVTDNGNGGMNIQDNYKDGPIAFSNTYTAEGNWTPEGSKEMTGRSYKEGETFTYSVKENGNEVATGSNTANGDITFTTIDYTLADVGTHTYEISENAGTDKGMAYDTTKYTVTVVVSDGGNGKLNVSVTGGAKENISFTNTYTAKGSWTPKGSKEMTGRDYKEGESFTYSVKENGEEVATGSNTANGDITFTSIDYELKDVGTHTYTISENAGEDAGMAYDNTEYTVKVTVTDAGNGKLDVKEEYVDGAVEFTNTYTAEGSWTPEGTKTLIGRDFGENETFKFVVKDEKGQEVSTGTVNKDSGGDTANKITFTPIQYDLEDIGSHTYMISEVDDKNSGLTYDTTIYTVVVDVADAGNGVLTATPNYLGKSVEFKNYYNARGSWRPEATKALVGSEYKPGEIFVYQVKENGNVVAVGFNNQDGKIYFPEINYTQDDVGKHTYTINEVKGWPTTGIAYDTTVFTVEVNVVDDGKGNLVAQSTYPKPAEFVNNTIDFYVNKIDLTSEEEVEGAELTVIDSTGKVVDQWISKKGEIHNFGDKLEAGKEYTLRETIAPEGYAYTADIIFKVEDDGKITLKSDVSTATGENNETIYLVKDTTLHFHVNKVDLTTDEEVEGAELAVIDKETGKILDSWVSKANEVYDFGDKLTAGRDYILREVTAPEGYAYTTDIEFSVEKDGEITTGATTTTGENNETIYLVEDTKLHFHVNKIDLTTDEEVEGAELAVIDKETGKILDSWVSKADEVYDFGDKLTAGRDYILREITAPEGYAYTTDIEFSVGKDGEITTGAETTTGENNETIYLVKDTKLHLKVNKVDFGNGEEVEGAELTLYDSKDNVIDTWESKAGEIHDFGSKLTAGETYTLVETVAPTGYAYTTNIVFTVNNDGSITTSVNSTIGEQGETVYLVGDEKLHFNVNKVELGSGKEVSGARLEVRDSEGNTVDAWVSEENKVHDFGSVLTAGESYTLVETIAPDGYYRYTATIEFTINRDGSITTTAKKITDEKGKDIYLVEDAPTEVTITKTDITTDEELPGATLQVLIPAAEGEEPVVATTIYGETLEWVSGTEAKVIKGLPAGDYILHEISAPYGYTIAEDVEFTITNELGVQKPVVMKNAPIELEITKTGFNKDGESVGLEGAKLEIRECNDDESIGDIVANVYNQKLRFDSTEGAFKLEGIRPGTYWLVETEAPAGYTIADPIKIEIEEDMTVSQNPVEYSMVNVPTEVTIRKTDLTTGEELPGATLQILVPAAEGEDPTVAKTIYGEELEWVSGENAKVIKGLPAGDYILHEVSAPAGYIVAEDIPFTITDDLEAENKVTMEDASIDLRISKTDIITGEELPGATLQVLIPAEEGEEPVVAKTVYGEVLEWETTDAPKEIKGLPAGEYILRETAAPNGYTIAGEIRFTVDEDGSITSDAYNEEMDTIVMEDAPTEVTITKTDITTDEELPGATLQVLIPAAEGEEPVVATTIYNETLEWVSGTEEKVIKGLPAGNYILREITAPYGYTIAKDVEFTITNELGVQEPVVMKNAPTELEITKTGFNKDGESVGLEGAKLEIRECNDDESIGDIVANVYNQKLRFDSTEGAFKLEGIRPGTYWLVETEAPAGYTIADPIKIEIEEDMTVSQNPVEYSMVNVPTEVTIRKTDLTTGEELPGATLQILVPAAEGEEPTVAQTIYGEELEWVSGETAKVIKGLPAGDYILHEVSAPAGYIVADDIPFTITDELEAENVVEMEDGSIEVVITKKDITTDEELPGATLQVLRQDEEELVVAETVYGEELEWESTEEAKVIKGLEAGDYILREITAPDGFTKAKDIAFRVYEDGHVTSEALDKETGEIVMNDAPTEVRITKTDITNDEELPGAVLQVLIPAEEGKEPAVATTVYGEKLEWTSTEEAKEIEGLPAGDYILREITAPDGFTIANDVKFTVTDELDVVAEVTMKDAPVELHVTKTGFTEDGKSVILAGAKMEIRERTAENGTGDIAVNVYGQELSFVSAEEAVVLKGVKPGNYWLVETEAPAGYTIAEPIEFTVKEDMTVIQNPVSVVMQDGTTQVTIRKTDITTGKELPGATLQILKQEGEELAVAQTIYGEKLEWVSGDIPKEIKGLGAGDYILREISAPNGYTVAEDVKFTITDDLEVAVKVVMENAPTEVSISKTDLTGKEELPGAKLQVLKQEGDKLTVVETIYGEKLEWISGEKPKEIKGIPAGDYILRETAAPNGYTVAEDVKFTLTDDLKAVNKVTMNDAPTEVSIRKTDITTGKELPGATLQVLKKEGSELVIVETIFGEKLEWVSGEEAKVIEGLPAGDYILREITAPDGFTVAEDVDFTVTDELGVVEKVVMEDTPIRLEISKTGFTKDGEVVALEGAKLEIRERGEDNSIGDIVTNAYGEKMRFESSTETVALNGVKPGNYWLVETNAPEGYTIADPIEITINEDMTVSQNPVTLIMEDCPTEVSISKTDITTGKELPGATLQVLKLEGEELTIVETIYGEKLEWVSGNTPKDIKGLAAGDYILREITAPEGYAVAEDVPFTITDDLNVENKVVMEDQPTEVTISKREMVGVSELPGASLLVLDENGEIATTIYGEKLEWVSGETAKVIRGLKAGNYTLVETESPDGYVVAEAIEFEVKDGEFIAQKVIMRDDTTKVQISKMDITNNAELAGAHLVLKDEAGEVIAEWTSTGKPKEINGQLIAGATYTLSEISAPAGYDLAKDITFTVDNTGEIQKVVMEDKVSDGKASITVQKLVMMDGEFIAIDYTFYVALFADKECTERVTNVKPLEVSGSYTTSTIFNHLQYGTYYVAETDEYGNAISEAEFVEAIEVLDGMATLTPTNATAKSIIINHIAGFNPSYYKDGEITVDKRVLIDGKEGNVTDKFYFALFTDAALTIMSDAGIRELELNNESGGTVTFENLPYGEYYLAETNKDGVPVDDTFAYNVTISSYCKVDGENRSVTRTVVNALENEKDKDKEENKDENDTTPTPTPTSSTTYSSGSGGGGSTSTTAAMATYTTGAKPAKTGDETPIGFYLFLLSVSGILLIGGYGRKRRRNSK